MVVLALFEYDLLSDISFTNLLSLVLDYLFIYSFIHLFIYSFIHLFIYSFTYLFIIYLFLIN